MANIWLRALWIIFFEILPMFFEEWSPKHRPRLSSTRYRPGPPPRFSPKPKPPRWLR